jgi:hypothetical protein
MKKLIIIIVLFFGIMVGSSYSANVTDDSKGNKGYILVNNGTGTGHQGTWTDPSFLKGDKGDVGATGATGKDGKNGVNGIDGKKGVDGLKGDKGDVGLTGSKGDAGKDVDPVTVNKFQNEINSNTKAINDLGNRVTDLESTQYIVGTEIRVYDSKKWTVSTFVDYTSTRNMIDRAGVRITYKVGQSAEEKQITQLQARLDRLEGVQEVKQRSDDAEVYTTENGMGIRSKF